MGYILTMKNRMDVKLTIDIDNDDIDFVLKQVKDYMNDYNVINKKKSCIMFKRMYCCFGTKVKEKLKQEIIKEVTEVVIPDIIHRLNETSEALENYVIDIEKNIEPLVVENEYKFSATNPPSITTMSM